MKATLSATHSTRLTGIFFFSSYSYSGEKYLRILHQVLLRVQSSGLTARAAIQPEQLQCLQRAIEMHREINLCNLQEEAMDK